MGIIFKKCYILQYIIFSEKKLEVMISQTKGLVISSMSNIFLNFLFISWNQNFVKGFPLLNYPNVCTDAPQAGKAFCDEHVAYLTSKHPDVPTDVCGF